MDWIEVTIYTSSDGIEAVTGRLYQLGVTGVSIEDEADFLEFLEDNKGRWDYVDDDLMKSMHSETKVKFYIRNDSNSLDMLSAVRQTLNELKALDDASQFGRLEIDTGELSEQDWANNWKQYFHTFEIGNRIVIQPEWEGEEIASDKLIFKINPGMSFGTGTHHTTKMCIEELDFLVKDGDNLLDLGCGSGILSLISLLLGANSAFAVDIDTMAVDISYQNAELNGISKGYEAVAGDILSDTALGERILAKEYEIVVANIVADVIIPLAPFAFKALKNGGSFITSGIIQDRADDVRSALLSVGFEIKKEKHSGEWVAFVCKKN